MKVLGLTNAHFVRGDVPENCKLLFMPNQNIKPHFLMKKLLKLKVRKFQKEIVLSLIFPKKKKIPNFCTNPEFTQVGTFS